MIKENSEEYIVEFSITIRDPTYSELLSDPAASQYNDITKELRDKVSSHCCCKHRQGTVVLCKNFCRVSLRPITLQLNSSRSCWSGRGHLRVSSGMFRWVYANAFTWFCLKSLHVSSQLCAQSWGAFAKFYWAYLLLCFINASKTVSLKKNTAPQHSTATAMLHCIHTADGERNTLFSPDVIHGKKKRNQCK